MSDTQFGGCTSSDNLALWNAAATTDEPGNRDQPSNASTSNRDVDLYQVIRRATQVFGPLGIGWGYEVVSEKTLLANEGSSSALASFAGSPTLYLVYMQLWYVLGRHKGTLGQYGYATLVKRDGDCTSTDGNAPANAVVDGLVKCLQLLGFACDCRADACQAPAKSDAAGVADTSGSANVDGRGPGATVGTGGIPEGSAASPTHDSGTSTDAEPVTDAGAGTRAALPVAPVQPSSSAVARADDVNAWLRRVAALDEDPHLNDARNKAPQYLKGNDLARVVAAINDQQVKLWLARIPNMSHASLKLVERTSVAVLGETSPHLGALKNAIAGRRERLGAVETP